MKIIFIVASGLKNKIIPYPRNFQKYIFYKKI